MVQISLLQYLGIQRKRGHSWGIFALSTTRWMCAYTYLYDSIYNSIRKNHLYIALQNWWRNWCSGNLLDLQSRSRQTFVAKIPPKKDTTELVTYANQCLNGSVQYTKYAISTLRTTKETRHHSEFDCGTSSSRTAAVSWGPCFATPRRSPCWRITWINASHPGPSKGATLVVSSLQFALRSLNKATLRVPLKPIAPTPLWKVLCLIKKEAVDSKKKSVSNTCPTFPHLPSVQLTLQDAHQSFFWKHLDRW